MAHYIASCDTHETAETVAETCDPTEHARDDAFEHETMSSTAVTLETQIKKKDWNTTHNLPKYFLRVIM